MNYNCSTINSIDHTRSIQQRHLGVKCMFPNKFFDKRKTWVSQVMEIATLHNLSMDPLTELDIASLTELDIASLTELDIASLTDLYTDIAWVASMEYLILPPLFSFFF